MENYKVVKALGQGTWGVVNMAKQKTTGHTVTIKKMIKSERPGEGVNFTAQMYGTPKTRLSPQAITLWYKPPELLLGALEYSEAANVWSAGCICA
jgi:serine/threonine protein kinase